MKKNQFDVSVSPHSVHFSNIRAKEDIRINNFNAFPVQFHIKSTSPELFNLPKVDGTIPSSSSLRISLSLKETEMKKLIEAKESKTEQFKVDFLKGGEKVISKILDVEIKHADLKPILKNSPTKTREKRFLTPVKTHRSEDDKKVKFCSMTNIITPDKSLKKEKLKDNERTPKLDVHISSFLHFFLYLPLIIGFSFVFFINYQTGFHFNGLKNTIASFIIGIISYYLLTVTKKKIEAFKALKRKQLM